MRKKRMNAAVSKVGTVFNCRISRNVKLDVKNIAVQFWRNIMVQKNGFTFVLFFLQSSAFCSVLFRTSFWEESQSNCLKRSKKLYFLPKNCGFMALCWLFHSFSTSCSHAATFNALAHIMPEFTANFLGAFAVFVLIFNINWKLGLSSL